MSIYTHIIMQPKNKTLSGSNVLQDTIYHAAIPCRLLTLDAKQNAKSTFYIHKKQQRSRLDKQFNRTTYTPSSTSAIAPVQPSLQQPTRQH